MKNYTKQSGPGCREDGGIYGLRSMLSVVRRYQTSYFKKLLELVWSHGNLEMKLEEYDRMSKQYSLGKLDKRHTTNNRARRGIVECKDASAANAYEARRNPRLHLNSDRASIRPISRNTSVIRIVLAY